MTVIRKAIFAVLVSSAIVSGTELALRVFVPYDALLFTWEQRDGPLIKVKGRMLPRVGDHPPRMDGAVVWREHINHQTFRESADTPAQKAPSTYRILALGDSWMYGISVDQGYTLPDELERRLTATRGQPVEVINAAVPSFSAFDMLWRWHQLSETLEFDGLLLGSPHNLDVEAAREGERSAWYGAVDAGDPIDLRSYLVLRLLLMRMRAPRYAIPPDLASPIDATRADILAIVNDARARSLPVWFVAYANEYSGSTPPPAAFEMWRSSLAALGVAVAGHGMRDRACWGQVDTAHPSVSGSRAIAAVVAPIIEGKPGASTWCETPACE